MTGRKNEGAMWRLGRSAFLMAALCCSASGCGQSTTVILVTATPAPLMIQLAGSNMEPNYHSGETVKVQPDAYVSNVPKRGDVVLYKSQTGTLAISRIIGVPGDDVSVNNGQVYEDGQRLSEPYVHSPTTCRNDFSSGRTVPTGAYFVLGDNRGDSYDSCQWPISPWLLFDRIVGKVITP